MANRKVLSFYINADLHMRAKIMAAKTNKTLSDVVDKALSSYLKKHEKSEAQAVREPSTGT